MHVHEASPCMSYAGGRCHECAQSGRCCHGAAMLPGPLCTLTFVRPSCIALQSKLLLTAAGGLVLAGVRSLSSQRGGLPTAAGPWTGPRNAPMLLQAQSAAADHRAQPLQHDHPLRDPAFVAARDNGCGAARRNSSSRFTAALDTVCTQASEDVLRCSPCWRPTGAPGDCTAVNACPCGVYYLGRGRLHKA
jgi:hypothetical protein